MHCNLIHKCCVLVRMLPLSSPLQTQVYKDQYFNIYIYHYLLGLLQTCITRRANVGPSLVTKLTLPFWAHRVGYTARVLLCGTFSFLLLFFLPFFLLHSQLLQNSSCSCSLIAPFFQKSNVPMLTYAVPLQWSRNDSWFQRRLDGSIVLSCRVWKISSDTASWGGLLECTVRLRRSIYVGVHLKVPHEKHLDSMVRTDKLCSFSFCSF